LIAENSVANEPEAGKSARPTRSLVLQVGIGPREKDDVQGKPD
jgi:hypothetical protein